MEETTEQLGALARQGPLSRAILNQVAEQPVDSLKYFRVAPNRIAGVDIDISAHRLHGRSGL